MAATLYNHPLVFGRTPLREGVLGSVGGPLFPLNTDAKTAESDINDPYEAAISGSATKLYFVTNPGASYLDLFLLVSGATDPSATTAVRPFGWVPVDARSDPGLKTPSEVDSTNFDALSHATLTIPQLSGILARGIFIPLFDPSTNVHEQVFSAGSQVHKDATTGSSKQFKVCGGRKVYCAGTHGVIVLVSAADSASTASMVFGRFVC